MEVKKLILIIDDEPDFVEMMRIFLENYGLRVISTADPDEGIKLARENPVDLILLDLNLPKKSGHQTCQEIKSDPNLSHIPVIILTCQEKTLDKVEAFNLGAADYICKTLSLEEILARIKAKLSLPSNETPIKIKEMIIELRRIIEQKDVRIFFQPIIFLSDKKILGYEAFCRGPEKTVFEDATTLFSFATEKNMFLDVELLSLSLAIQKAEFLTPSQYLFLNVDPLFLGTKEFKDLVFLKNSKILPKQLCFEITERSFIKNFADLASILNYFHTQGIKIAIDDVGEGYSSLKAIVELQPTFIKIDMGMVRNVDHDSTKRLIVQLIVEIAKKLNIFTIAEGIETEEEINTLASLGVDYGQGYLIGKPQQSIIL